MQWSFLPAMVYLVLRSMLAAIERPGWAVVTGAAAIGVNAALNALLIHGAGPVPALGLTGSGLATVLANVFLAATLGLVVIASPRFRRYRILSGLMRPHRETAAALWRLGLPIGIAIMLETGMFAAAAALIGHYDEASLAAHAIALQVASFAFVVPLGIAQAATVRVGRAAGAGDDDAVARSGWTGPGARRLQHGGHVAAADRRAAGHRRPLPRSREPRRLCGHGRRRSRCSPWRRCSRSPMGRRWSWRGCCAAWATRAPP